MFDFLTPNLVFSLAMLAVLTLGIGGVRLMARDRKRGILMIVAALVLLGNVLLLAWPT